MSYIFRIDSFHIYRTRAQFTDTDLLGVLLHVGDHTYPPVMRHMGDVADGEHTVDLEIGPIDIPSDATPVIFSYNIVNSNTPASQLKGYIRFILNAFADFGGQNVPFGIGTLINDFLMFPFHNMVFSDCDGVVVVDVISLTGKTLAGWTGVGNPYTETRRYPGRLDPYGAPEYQAVYPSPGTCGDTSDYSLTWSVLAVPPDTGHRQLVQRRDLVAISGYTTLDGIEHIVVGSVDFPALKASPGSISSLTMAASDGRAVHEGQAPQAVFRDLATMCAYTDGFALYVVVAASNGDLHFGSAPGQGGPTTIGPAPFAQFPGVVALAAFATFGHHVFIGLEDGSIVHAQSTSEDGTGAWDLSLIAIVGSGRRIAALAAYHSSRDGYGHVVAACDDGDLLDIRLSPDPSAPEPIFQDVRAHVDGAIAAAGYFSSGDTYAHVYVGRSNGEIHEIWYPGVANAGQGGVCVRAQFSDIVALAAYPGFDDASEHLVVGLKDGTVQEVVWKN